jgi:tRNA pseudouridine55 synthase
MHHQLNGVIVLNKPAGLSSAKAVSKVKKLLNVSKAGHSGTLDPFATGVLVCCINQATRLAGFFLHGRKTYEAVLHLGIETDTQDCTGGRVRQARVPELSDGEVHAIFDKFLGPQMQHPPVYAALKHCGTPLYKLARQGRPVQKPARPITIEALKLLDIDLPLITFEVTCSAGTYIRSLCADLGQAMGCGGHLARLHRTTSSGFEIIEAVPLATLEGMDLEVRAQTLIPMAAALRKIPAFTADPEILQRVAYGQKLSHQEVPLEDLVNPVDGLGGSGYVKVVDAENNLKAVLQTTPGGTHYNYCCVFN